MLSDTAGGRHAPAQNEAKGCPSDAEAKVQHVACAVHRNKICRAGLVKEDAAEAKHQINHTAVDQEAFGCRRVKLQDQPGDAKKQVHDVVEHRDLEDP